MNSAPLFVSFHTGDARYTAYADKLRASLERHHLAHEIGLADERPTWVETCALKPRWVAHAAEQTARPLVWLDADAEVVARPGLLLDCTADFAISTFAAPRTRMCVGVQHTLPAEYPRDEWFNAGTIYFGATPKGRELALRWCAVQQEHPRWWDQWTLQQAWCDVRPDTLWLPDSYCRTRLCRGETVIRQALASTEYAAVRA